MSESLGDYIDLINRFWPDFHITEELIRNPTFEYITDFFTKFLRWHYKILAEMCGEESFLANKAECPPLADVVSLYILVTEILKSMGINYFKLNDLYRPTFKRTFVVFKAVVNFVSYFESITEEVRDMTNEVLMMAQTINIYKDQLENLKEDIGEKAREFALSNDELVKLEKDYEAVQQLEQEHDKKKQLDKVKYELLRTELEGLQRMYSEEQELYEKLANTELHLQEQIVSDEECNVLKSNRDALQAELVEIEKNNERLYETIAQKAKVLEHFKSLRTELESASLTDFSNVILLENKINDLRIIKNDNTNTAQEVENSSSVRVQISQNINELDEYEASLVLKANLKRESIEKDMDNLKIELQDKIVDRKYAIDRKESLNLAIINVKSECESLQQDFNTVNEVHEQTYKKILEAESAVYVNFNNMLKNL